jgi:hypothetical protein
MITIHEKALGGRVPSCGSLPCPEKAMGSPTFQVNAAVGARIVAVGLPASARIVIGAEMSLPPRWSVTLRRAE